jgi:tRNA pseudouridine13 synthase
MHIKQRPEDFEVEELTDVQPEADGAFALYRLEKRGWTTPDALAAVRRRWQLDARRVSYGGLKDRHAHTVQYLTVFHGPERKLTHADVHVTYLGRTRQPYTSEHIRANRFRLTIRDLTAAEADAARAALDEVRQTGVPNYFDDQRFGSVAGHKFVARHLVLGEYEEALKLALAAPYPFDRAPQKKEKAILRQHWGDWPKLKERLPRGHARSLVDYLASHPNDFRGAVARLRPDLRGLYLSAYQSHLWNRMLAHWLRHHGPAGQLVSIPLRLGALPMPQSLTDEQRADLAALRLPLHSARIHLDDADPRKPYFDRVLAEEELTQTQFQLKGLREMFFSKGDRPALCLPSHLEGTIADDDEHPGRQKMTLAFELPRGSYATLIVKRITRLELGE